MLHEAAVVVHVAAGGLGLLSGFAALAVRKGARVHRVIGYVFFASMLSMAAFATVLASLASQRLNVVAGVFTLYLVATAWATVRRRPGTVGPFDIGATIVALTVAASAFALGLLVANGLRDGDAAGNLPPPYFIFGSLAALAAAMDVRVVRSGGVRGAERIRRHLWRMCLALLIAAASFYPGQEDEIPQSVNGPHLLVPALAALAALIFWMIRTRPRPRKALKPVPAPA